MEIFESTTDISKIYKDDNFYYFLCGPSNLDFVLNIMRNKKTPKGFYVIGPEEWEPIMLFSHPMHYESFKSYADKHKITFKLITGAVTDKSFNPNFSYAGEEHFINHPTYWAHLVINHAVEVGLLPFDRKKKINKLFTSLNARAHPWRCEFIDTMFKYGLFEFGYISWHELDKNDTEYAYEWKHWKPRIMNFDVNWNSANGVKDLFLPPYEFKTSAISLISESNTRCLFYTEKTFVPIFHQRPFVIYGAPYANTYLKQIGFEIFENLIDYSFDSILDDTERCQAYFKEVAKLKDMHYNDIVTLCQNAVQHNFNNMISIVENKEYINKIWDQITYNNDEHEYLSNYKRVLNIATSTEYILWKQKLKGKHGKRLQ